MDGDTVRLKRKVHMTEERYYSLDFLKIIATIGIIFHHWQQVTGAYFENHINFCNGRFYWGYLVELFFVLSGFFCYRYIRKIREGMDFKAFILRRIKRLLPMVAITAIAYEINLYFYYSLYTQGVEGSWFGVTITFWGTIIDMLGIQDGWVFSNPLVNNPTWYISVLILNYILFFLTVWIAGKKHIPVEYLFVLLIFLGCGIQTFGISLPFMNNDTARGYCAFFAGVMLSNVMNRYTLRPWTIVIAMINVIVVPYLIVYRSSWISSGLSYTLCFIFYPSLIILFQTKPVKKLFSSRFWGTWGKISFDVFMWHNLLYLTMYIAMKAFNFSIDFSKVSNMYLYAIFCEVFGVVSYYLIERPLDRHLKLDWFLKRKDNAFNPYCQP